MIWLVVLLLFVFFLYIVLPSIFKIILRDKFLWGLKTDNSVYITFDDGPNPESTPKILSLLKKYNSKATFFVTGKNAEKHPELIKDILSKGHAIGCHGYNHLHAWKIDPYSSIMDFMKFNRVLRSLNLSVDKVTLYRPPYGKLNLVILLYVLFTNMKYVFWDIDPMDYGALSSDSVAKFIINRIKPGSVVLLHDGRGKKENNSPQITVNALNTILKSLLEKKLKFIPIGLS